MRRTSLLSRRVSFFPRSPSTSLSSLLLPDVNPRDYRAWYGLGQTYELLDMAHYAIQYYNKATALRFVSSLSTLPLFFQSINSHLFSSRSSLQTIRLKNVASPSSSLREYRTVRPFSLLSSLLFPSPTHLLSAPLFLSLLSYLPTAFTKPSPAINALSSEPNNPREPPSSPPSLGSTTSSPTTPPLLLPIVACSTRGALPMQERVGRELRWRVICGWRNTS